MSYCTRAKLRNVNVCRHSVGGGGGGGGGGEGGRVVMEQERVRLAREEESLKTAVQQMSKDVAQLRESITQLGIYTHTCRALCSTCNTYV